MIILQYLKAIILENMSRLQNYTNQNSTMKSNVTCIRREQLAPPPKATVRTTKHHNIQSKDNNLSIHTNIDKLIYRDRRVPQVTRRTSTIRVSEAPLEQSFPIGSFFRHYCIRLRRKTEKKTLM